MNKKWYVYIVKCNDDTLYTGITVDLERRIFEHNNDNIKGSKYSRYKRPVELVFYEIYSSQSEARKREAAIKKW